MPIAREEIQNIVSQYDTNNISIGVIGSHSALELGMSAKSLGAKTVVVVQEGRDEIYVADHPHLYDNVIKVKKFSHIVNDDVQEKLRSLNTIFVPNRSFSAYIRDDLGYEGIEEKFKVPIYGNRFLLQAEERTAKRNQYYLLEKAGIRTPKRFEKSEEIDRLVIVKVQRADKPLERTFFYASSPEDFKKEVERYEREGLINDEVMQKAVIEEFVLGARFNANFHSYALEELFGELDLVGYSDRRQVNQQGFLNLPAREQLKIDVPVTNEEVGHYGITPRESLQPLFWKAAKRFRKIAKEEYSPGLIGLFGLQGAIAYSPVDKKTLEFVVFDVSPRIPGDPAMGPTSPEMRNLSLKHRREIGDPLDLTVMEIQKAAELNRLQEIVT